MDLCSFQSGCGKRLHDRCFVWHQQAEVRSLAKFTTPITKFPVQSTAPRLFIINIRLSINASRYLRMSKTVHIASTAQFSALLGSSSIVVADFYADWCGPCKAIAPLYEQLSQQLSRPNRITFAKINTDQQQELSQAYGVRVMPTFMIFKNARKVETITGADQKKLSEAVKKLAAEASAIGEGTVNGGFGEDNSAMWLGAELPKGYRNITDEVDILGLELLNRDTQFGTARTLFGSGKPKGAPHPQSP
jgi:thioredoxin